jgi:UDP-glucuronate decarboxylase
VTFPLYVEVDEIYNLACPASPVHYQHDPVQTTKTSVHGAINMLGLAKRVRPRSSRPRPARSTATPASIRRSRLLGQRQSDRPAPATTRASAAPRPCSSTTTASTAGIKVGRIFNTYGPRMHPNDGRVVSNFIVQALKGEPITLYGDGSRRAASAMSTTWSTASCA